MFILSGRAREYRCWLPVAEEAIEHVRGRLPDALLGGGDGLEQVVDVVRLHDIALFEEDLDGDGVGQTHGLANCGCNLLGCVRVRGCLHLCTNADFRVLGVRETGDDLACVTHRCLGDDLKHIAHQTRLTEVSRTDDELDFDVVHVLPFS
jgi:hypothetical protein